MPDGYVDLEFLSDPEELRQRAYDRAAQLVPGWEPHPAAPEVVLIDQFVDGIAVAIAQAANEVPETIFHDWLAQRFGLPEKDGVPAQLTVLWTFRDAAGYTVPAGALLSVVDPAGEDVLFAPIADVVCPLGDTQVYATVYAVEEGAGPNGLTPAAGEVQLIEILDYVERVDGDGSVTGGGDPETEEEYLDRGYRRLRGMGGGLVLPGDYADAALDIDGVARATAIDGFIPPSSTGQERAVAVAVHAPDGSNCSAPVKTAVQAYLASRREVNFVVNVIDPARTTINVAATAVAFGGYDPAQVGAAAEAAVASYLDPAQWGTVSEGDMPGLWVNVNKVRYFEVVHVLEGVVGLDILSTLTLNAGTSDVTLSGVAPLPTVGTITVTVTAP